MRSRPPSEDGLAPTGLALSFEPGQNLEGMLPATLPMDDLDMDLGGVPGPGLRLHIGPGPTDGYCATHGVGFSGPRALHYVVSRPIPSFGPFAAGRGQVLEAVVVRTRVRVTERTHLRYRIYPGRQEGTEEYAATWTAVDLRFADGGRLSALGARDQYGFALSPAGQGEGKVLAVRQWNQVECDVGALAAGRVVEALTLRCRAAEAGTVDGWIADLVLVEREETGPRDPVDRVDTRRGTNSSALFSRGNTFPATAWPNGFNFLTPLTDAHAKDWFYSWSGHDDGRARPRLQALGLSHQPSPWMGDRNQLLISPWPGPGSPPESATDRALAFDHDRESARPHHYGVELDCGLHACMSPTDHGAVFHFADDGAAPLQLLLASTDTAFHVEVDTAARTFEGRVAGASALSVGAGPMYFHGRVGPGGGRFPAAGAEGPAPSSEVPRDAPLPGRVPPRPGSQEAGATRVEEVRDAGPLGRGPFRILTVPTPGPGGVEVRVATSFVSVDQARHTFDLELADRPRSQIVADARRAWNERLGVLELEGASEEQAATAYSCLYRLNLYPNSQFENAGTRAEPRLVHASPVLPPGPHGPRHTGAVVREGRAYVNHGFWDTYRTVWPLYGLLYPDLAAELADGFVEQYRSAGWIARWSAPGWADLMTGTSSDVAFADLYVNGVDLPDVASTYAAALRDATARPTAPGVGRKDLADTAYRGAAGPHLPEAVSWAVEAAVNDHAVARMAQRMAARTGQGPGRDRLLTEARYLLRRSLAYRNLFDPDTGFFQSRHPDGTFRLPAGSYDPRTWGGDYTEANGWTFAFPAPHDGAGLARLHARQGPGGDRVEAARALAGRLEEFFATPEDGARPGTYPSTMHEITEARDLRMGQWAISNQPAHHIAHMWHFASRPDRANAAVREALARAFTGGSIGQGWPGDEDNGEMSAWYLFAMTGLYPLQHATGRYALTSPLHPRVTWHLPGGDLVVRTRGTGVHVAGMRIDGREHSECWVEHERLARGALVEVDLAERPSDWGTTPPPSLDPDTEPWRDLTSRGRVALVRRRATAGGPPASGRVGRGSHLGSGRRRLRARMADRAAAHALVDDRAASDVALGCGDHLEWHSPGPAATALMYTLTCGSDPSRAPTAWTLSAWEGRGEWIVVDRREDQTFDWPGQLRPFAVPDPRPWRAYRWTPDAPADAVLSQWELLV